jgi:hypothetical protein
MANVTATYQATISVSIEIADSKLKKFLAGDIEIDSYWEIELKGLPKSFGIDIKSTNNTMEISIDDVDYSDIVKDNGNEYEWDGDSLTKI